MYIIIGEIATSRESVSYIHIESEFCSYPVYDDLH